jgi:hypothetical protein
MAITGMSLARSTNPTRAARAEDVLLVLIGRRGAEYVQEAAAAVGDLCGIEPPKRRTLPMRFANSRAPIWREFEAEQLYPRGGNLGTRASRGYRGCI